MDIYCGIDGTLNDDTTHLPALAKPEMLTSYVRRIGLLGFDRFHYLAGPTSAFWGWDTKAIAQQAMVWIDRMLLEQAAKSNAVPRIFLGGFSRGAAAAWLVCKFMADRGFGVQGLFLFDAVDRTLRISNSVSTQVPQNV